MVDPAGVLRGRTRETKIRRDSHGRWFDDDVEITHPLLTRAFDRWLVRAPDGSGRFCLSNDINWAFVEVDGPPRFVRAVRAAVGGVELHLSDGTVSRLDPHTLRQDRAGALYCDVAGELCARFDRSAVMGLAALVGEDERGIFVRIGAELVRPPTTDDPLAPLGRAD